ncbi:MAG: ribonuclease J [Deltaproteobacteria bacterium]|uniref:Ribonuclease J n=1 Tax=Candidatus Desulfacyla euxinica TaxID=2841693 RepID=A0A8J6T7G6_9DELT|nr:ribonuclease J [Candidatus Desulfacyla euxinica]
MLKIIPIGGLGEIGLNMMAIEYGPDLLIVDAGLMFPNDYMPGIDLVIPDFTYIRENKEKLKALILTHGHEDHIGAIPFFLKEFPLPVFGTSFTLGLLRAKLKEHHLPEKAELREIKAGDITRLGPFNVEYISVNHSIVDGVGLAIDTPEGILLHSGDFRIDPTPVDSQFTDLIRFAHFGEKGVLAFFSDSTNAEKEGYTLSEKDVRKTLDDLFQTCRGRLVVASFASNITRIQQVISLAVKFGRKVVFNGKSMITNVGIAKEQGFIHIPEDSEISERQIKQFPDQKILIITTGSQGEPMSALTRMARGKHKGIEIKSGDTIILSSRFIPGNEKAITSVINSLYRLGADVVYEKVSDIHTSGHARREELKLMLSLVKPRYFVPIHGEYRHLVKHAQIASEMGMPDDRILIAEDGNVICFENHQMHMGESVATGRILVDGKGVGDIGETVLRDRRKLGGHGMVLILLIVDEETGETIYGPEIISRGFVFENQGQFILEDAECIVLEVLDELERPSPLDCIKVESEIRRMLKRFFYNVIERSPLIIPVIIAV